MRKEQASAGDAADGYDLKESPAAGPAKPPRPPVLAYEPRAAMQQAHRRRMLQAWRPKDLWLPGAILAAGLACRLLLGLSHSTDGGVRAVVIMALVALATVFNVLVMLAGLTIASRHVDLEPLSPAPTVIKLGLMFVAGASAGGFLANLGNFSVAGLTMGVNALFLIYWVLFSRLFRAGLTETMMSVAIIGLMQAVLNVGIWKL